MKIQFDDNSYVYFSMSENGKIMITISAKDYDNSLRKIVNSCEVSVNEFNELISDIKYKE